MSSRIGQKLGNYTLVNLIGEGGFADVYLGEHIYLKTLAAIKILQVRLTDDTLEQFLAEARLVARLSHPHVVSVLEFGIEEGTPFLVMAYAPYGSLRKRHPRKSQLPLPTVIQYVTQVAAGLQYAHEQKIIHRDVKPENMLLSQNQTVMLTDFGIAVQLQNTRISSDAQPQNAGTSAYMAPEQFNGQPVWSSDQYALAIVVYEWLCGEVPFIGSIMEVAIQHLQRPVPSLRTVRPDITPQVEQVIIKALAKEPTERFVSVQEFANALEQASRVPAIPSPIQAFTSTTTRSTPFLRLPTQEKVTTNLNSKPTVAQRFLLTPGPMASTPAHLRSSMPVVQPAIHPSQRSLAPSRYRQDSIKTRRQIIIAGGAGLVFAGVMGVGATLLWQQISSSGNTPQLAGPPSNQTIPPTLTPTPTVNAAATALVTLNSVQSKPVLVSQGSGLLDLFVLGPDNQIWHRSYNQKWQAWETLDGSVTSDPAVASWGLGRLDVFVRGADNSLLHRVYNGSWQPLETLGGSSTSAPAAVSWGPNRLDVFIRGADNGVWHNWFDGTWHNWEPLGGIITAAPTVAAWSASRLDLFVRGADNALWTQSFNGTWSGWVPMGGSYLGDPTVASLRPGHLDVFVRGADNTLVHRWFEGNWQDWQSLGGALGSSPAAVALSGTSIEVFARASDNTLQTITYNGNWQTWTPFQ